MNPDEELKEKGEKVFLSLSGDDKRALKRFLTGQIQNILANEHGIGGRRDAVSEATTAVTAIVEKRFNDGDYLATIIERILQTRSHGLIGIVEKVAAKLAKEALLERFNDAASQITFNVSVEEKAVALPENFGRF